MHISFEGKLAVWLAVVGLAGAGALEVIPERAYIGYGLLTAAASMALFLLWHHLCGWLGLEWGKTRHKMVAVGGMIVCAAGLIVFAGVYFWPSAEGPLKTPQAASNLPPQTDQEPSRPAEVPPSIPERRPIDRAELLSRMRNKYPDRIIADVTPDYLLGLYKDRMTILGDRDVAPFIGKWFVLSGRIHDIISVGHAAKNGIVIQFMLVSPEHILMFFDTSWNDHLSILLPKQEFSAFCRLDSISSGTQVRFDPCEPIYLESGAGITPAPSLTNPPAASPPSPELPASPGGTSP